MVEKAILVVKEDGRIEDFVHPVESPALYSGLETHPDLERYSGWLVPGLINSHCHLELSYAKGLIPRNTGLPDFLKSVTKLRDSDREKIEVAMVAAELEMMEEGIVAVGDISNTDHSLALKSRSPLRYHTFVEVFDLHPDRAKKCFDEGSGLVQSFRAAGLRATMVPHATYTVSSKLLSMLAVHAGENRELLSIHNQETPSEDDFFRTGTGRLAHFLHGTGLYDDWKPTGLSALRSIMSNIVHGNRIMLVHDTFTKEEDVSWVKGNIHDVWWCLCPKANDYIERSLPDARLLLRQDQRILIGTDSLASNDRLSVLDEISLLMAADTTLPFEALLRAATADAAAFFGWEHELGELNSGMRPGILLVNQSTEKSGKVTSGGLLVGPN